MPSIFYNFTLIFLFCYLSPIPQCVTTKEIKPHVYERVCKFQAQVCRCQNMQICFRFPVMHVILVLLIFFSMNEILTSIIWYFIVYITLDYNNMKMLRVNMFTICFCWRCFVDIVNEYFCFKLQKKERQIPFLLRF